MQIHCMIASHHPSPKGAAFTAMAADLEPSSSPPHKAGASRALWALLDWAQLVVQAVLQLWRVLSTSPAFRPLAVDEDAAEAHQSVEMPLDKLTVVLDLDETLVCSYERDSLPATVRNQAIEAGLKCFELQCISTDKEIEGSQKVNHVVVFERPGLHEFLRQTSEFADLVLFTAGLEDYASPLVDKIDKENRFSLRLYRPATVSTDHRQHVKDLSFLSKDLRRIVIVDNNPFSFVLQPLNGIPCVPFSALQPYDEQLIGNLLPLLKHLGLQKDVRSVLRKIFHMPEWFQKHGNPTRDRLQ